MQNIQAASWLLMYFIPKTSGNWLTYTAFFFFLNLMCFVPIASIIHYVINWDEIYKEE